MEPGYLWQGNVISLGTSQPESFTCLLMPVTHHNLPVRGQPLSLQGDSAVVGSLGWPDDLYKLVNSEWASPYPKQGNEQAVHFWWNRIATMAFGHFLNWKFVYWGLIWAESDPGPLQPSDSRD